MYFPAAHTIGFWLLLIYIYIYKHTNTTPSVSFFQAVGTPCEGLPNGYFPNWDDPIGLSVFPSTRGSNWVLLFHTVPIHTPSSSWSVFSWFFGRWFQRDLKTIETYRSDLVSSLIIPSKGCKYKSLKHSETFWNHHLVLLSPHSNALVSWRTVPQRRTWRVTSANSRGCSVSWTCGASTTRSWLLNGPMMFALGTTHESTKQQSVFMHVFPNGPSQHPHWSKLTKQKTRSNIDPLWQWTQTNNLTCLLN